MNFEELKKEMRNQKITQGKIAEKLKIDRVSLNYKLNGKYQFTLSEIVKIKEILNIEDVEKYFFK